MLPSVNKRIAALCLAGASVLALAVLPRVMPLEDPEARGATPGTVVLDARGVVLSRDTDQGVRIPVSLARVAPAMIRATVSAEDRRFYLHPGIDPIAAARAIGELPSQRSGASTITQQL